MWLKTRRALAVSRITLCPVDTGVTSTAPSITLNDVATLSGYPSSHGPSGITEVYEGTPEVRHHLGKYVFSEEGWVVLEAARGASAEMGRDEIGSADFLLALVTSDDPSVTELLESWGVDLDAVRARIEQLAAEEEASEVDPPPAEGETGPAT